MKRRNFLACVGGLAMAPSATWPARAQAPNEMAVVAGHGPLDGRVFVGRIGPHGDPDVEDELYFRDGLFWSSGCTRCGFRPGAYFNRQVGDEIHFRGELEGNGGRFFVQGVVAGDRLDAAIRWVKRRWYWTIERDIRFVGVVRPGWPLARPEEARATANQAQAAGLKCSL